MPAPDTPAVNPAQLFPNPYGPQFKFNVPFYPPATALYIGPNERLLLNIRTPNTAVNLTFTYNLLKFDGTVECNTQSAAIAATGAGANNQGYQPSEGFLLSYQITTDNVARGQCYIKTFVQSQNQVALLGQSYTSSMRRQTYPCLVSEDSLDGAGFLRTVNVADVTGGAPAWTVPAGCHWKFKSIKTQFTASAAGVARSLAVQVQEPGTGNQGAFVGAAGTIAPSGSQQLNWAPGLTALNAGLSQCMGFPRELMLGPGYVVSLIATILDVNDKFQINNAIVEEYVGL